MQKLIEVHAVDYDYAARAAARFVELQSQACGEPRLAKGAREARERRVAAEIMRWHQYVEPLRLDLLSHAERDFDLAHDVSGILRQDRLQSARFALAYHKR